MTSAAGSDLLVRLEGAFVAGSSGVVTEPGGLAHWPGGLCVCYPAQGCANGTVVLAPGDLNLTFKSYVRDPVTLRLEDDRVVAVEGEGLDADLLRSHLAAFGDEEAYAISHIGWGMNHGCPLGLPAALRPLADQRHRGPGLRRQRPLLDRRQRERRPLHARALRPAAAALHGRAGRPGRGRRRRALRRAQLTGSSDRVATRA